MIRKNEEEQFIFRRMAEGDEEAFRFFFEKYYDDMCNVVNMYLHDPVMAEEIVQDIFVLFWESRKKIAIQSSVKFYLFRMSRNKSLNHIRNQKCRLRIHEKLLKESETSYEMPENVVHTGFLNHEILQAVNSLPEKCREIYIMGKEDNLPYKEIARQMGISVKTVENQMGKAMKRLREHLQPYYNEILMVLILLLVG